MRYTIRDGRPDDWAAARALRLEMLRNSPHAFGDRLEDVTAWDDERWRVRSSSMTMPDSAWAVAVSDDGRFLGQMAGRDYFGEAWLLEVYVAPGARGSGAAGRLLAEIEAWAAARGHRRLYLDVSERSTAARRFYARSGFVETGKFSPHPLFPSESEIEMVKQLTDN
ncbi:MAG: GNAT family N-acetyltransferase [Propionibacterium sp.]|nr:GNAT family N-acetyltransferase [Propionibacterium sp.]